MTATHIQHSVQGKEITEVNQPGLVISNAQQFLDLIMNLPADAIILHKENLDEAFFELRTGIAGEILQKVVNYSRQLAIVGNFSMYDSKALRDFIFESNKSNTVVFMNTVSEALEKLSR